MKFRYIYGRKFTKYLHGTWSLLNILMIFWPKRKMYNFDPYNVLLAIATNIPVLVLCSRVTYVQMSRSTVCCVCFSMRWRPCGRPWRTWCILSSRLKPVMQCWCCWEPLYRDRCTFWTPYEPQCSVAANTTHAFLMIFLCRVSAWVLSERTSSRSFWTISPLMKIWPRDWRCSRPSRRTGKTSPT